MKRIQLLLKILLLTMAVINLGANSSHAQNNSEETKVYLTQISCRELLKMPGEDRRLTLVFFHGFMSAKDNQMIVDRIQLREATDKITDYCIDNPDETLMNTFDEYR